MSHANTAGASPAQTENATSRPKQRTIIRLLSTKFTTRAPSATPPPLPPPSAAAKEQRAAALRAVGLLPPLCPNKDLSYQEMEQDQHIPIVPIPLSEDVSPSDPEAAAATNENNTENQPSAADLIRKEWVSKNQPTSPVDVESEQLDRLTKFKFGGSTASLVVPPPPPPPAAAAASTDTDAGEPEQKVDGSLSHASADQLDMKMTASLSPPDPNHSGPVVHPPASSRDPERSLRPVPQESLAVTGLAATKAMAEPSPPPSPLLDIPPEIRAYMSAVSVIPPSPKGSSSSLRSAPSSSSPPSPPPERDLPPPPLPTRTQTQTQIPELVLSDTETETDDDEAGHGCLMDDAKSVPAEINLNLNLNLVTPQSISISIIPSGESGSRVSGDGSGSGDGTESGSGTSTPRPNVLPAAANTLEPLLPSSSSSLLSIAIPAIEIDSPATPTPTLTPGGKDAVAETDGEDTTPFSEPTTAPVQAAAAAAAAGTPPRLPSSDSDDISSPSISSITTPSLVSSQTSSSASASASSSNEALTLTLNSPTPKPLLLAPGKLGTLQVRTTGAERVPAVVVIASPVESGRFSEELELEGVVQGECEVASAGGEVEVEVGVEIEQGKEGQGEGEGEGETAKGTETPKASRSITGPPASAPPTTLTFQKPSTSPSAAANANTPTPAPKKAQVDRRRTLNPFKRAQTVGPGSAKSPSSPAPSSSGTGRAFLSPDAASPSPSSQPKRRLTVTVGSSFSNIRKSVVGTLSSKGKMGGASASASAGASASATSASGSGVVVPRISTSDRDASVSGTPKKGKGFDASHLPPSPTVPSSFVGSGSGSGSFAPTRRSGGGGGGSTDGGSRAGFGFSFVGSGVGGIGSGNGSRMSPPPTPTRLARPVVMHTGGSILEQTAGIEDAETRRVTELAFM